MYKIIISTILSAIMTLSSVCGASQGVCDFHEDVPRPENPPAVMQDDSVDAPIDVQDEGVDIPPDVRDGGEYIKPDVQDDGADVPSDGISIEERFLSDVRAAIGDDADIRIYEPCDLDAETLEHRTENGIVVVERYVGVVVSQNGDGKIENAVPNFDYINYGGVNFPAPIGTKIVTYSVYNTGNDYIDDVMLRFDYLQE